MKIRYNVNTCDNGPHRSELMVHFTKLCPNSCPFCIDKFNIGVHHPKPDVDAIIKTIDKYKDKVNDIYISGGEPFIFIDELDKLTEWIEKNTNLKISFITSIPNICYEEKEKFFKILDRCTGNIQISLQYCIDVIGDKIRGSKSIFNRKEFYKEIIDRVGQDKIIGSINIFKPYFNSKYDVIRNVCEFNQIGFKNIKICELFDCDNFYIDIPKLLDITLPPPFAYGCKTEYKNTADWILNGKPFNGHLYIKRSCFYKTNLQKATIWDLIKRLTRWIFSSKYFFGVIHENGKIYPYWQ